MKHPADGFEGTTLSGPVNNETATLRSIAIFRALCLRTHIPNTVEHLEPPMARTGPSGCRASAYSATRLVTT